MTPFPFPLLSTLCGYDDGPGPTRRYVLDGQFDGIRQGVYAMSACSNGTLLAIGGEHHTLLLFGVSLL